MKVPTPVKRTSAQEEAKEATTNHISSGQEGAEEGSVAGDLIAPPGPESVATKEAHTKESMQKPLTRFVVETPLSPPDRLAHGVRKSTGLNRKIPVKKRKVSNFLHDDGGLQTHLPTLEEQLEQLKNTKVPAMSTKEQLDILWKHSRRTDRDNKKHGLESSRFSNEAVHGLKCRTFMRWAALAFGPVVAVQAKPKMNNRLSERWHKWVEYRVNTRFNHTIVTHGHRIRVAHWRGMSTKALKRAEPFQIAHEDYDLVMKELKKAVEAEAAFWMSPEQIQRWLDLPQNKKFMVACFIVSQAKKKRLCWDFKELNKFGSKIPFKGDGMKQIIESIKKNDYAMSLDMKSFFHHFRLDQDSHRWCVSRIETKEGVKWLQITSLFFGLRDIPYVTRRCFAPIIAHMRSVRGVRICGTTDDWTIVTQGFTKTCQEFLYFVHMLMDLGFIIAVEKYQSKVRDIQKATADQHRLSHRRRIQIAPHFIFQLYGYTFNTRLNAIFVQRRKILALKTKLLATRNIIVKQLENTPKIHPRITFKDAESILGIANSMTRAIPQLQIWLYSLRIKLMKALKTDPSRSGTVRVNGRVAAELATLANHVLQNSNGSRLKHVKPHIHLVDDAGPIGMGGTLVSTKESMAQIFRRSLWGASQNMKELLGDIMVARHFIEKHNLRNLVIGILSDNSTSVSYMEGRLSVTTLAYQSVMFLKEMWQTRGIRFVATHIPGTTMVEIGVDNLSRVLEQFKEWKLDLDAFHWTCSWARDMINTLDEQGMKVDQDEEVVTTDLFASMYNTRCTRFLSLNKCEQATYQDAFSQQWDAKFLGKRPWAFPPAHLINRALDMAERAKGVDYIIFITPSWPQQTWWTRLLQMAKVPPMHWSRNKELMHPPQEAEYIRMQSPEWALTSWIISPSASNTTVTKMPQSKTSLIITRTSTWETSARAFESGSGIVRTRIENTKRLFGTTLQAWTLRTGCRAKRTDQESQSQQAPPATTREASQCF
jgi:hypothetical protein